MKTIENAAGNPFFKSQNEDLYLDKKIGLIKKDYMITYMDYLIKEEIPFGAYLCNIDDYSVINEFYGEEIGDQLLSEVARKLEEVIGDKGLVAKCVGDEYLIIVENIAEYNDLWTIGRDLTYAVSKELFKSIGDSYLTMTTGCARFPLDGTNTNEMFICLNKALYRGKIKGKNCFIVYLKEKHENIEVKKRERLNTSLDVTAKVLDILALPNIETAINDTLHFLLTHYQLDHIGIETETGLYFSHHNMKVENEGFEYIDSQMLDKTFTGDGIFKYSTRNELAKAGFDDIIDELTAQQEESMLLVKMIYSDDQYGILRIDMKKPRIWQQEEVSLFLTTARVIAILLNKNKTTIDELKKKK